MAIWKERVFTHWDMITALSRRRFGETALAEEAVLAAIEKLSENDWDRLKQYKKKAKFQNYLRVVVLRLFEDFSRKRFGRTRPPVWVTQLGGIWQKLFVALCLERLAVLPAVETVHQQQQKLTKEHIEDAAYTLLGKIPQCGNSNAETSFDEITESEFVVSENKNSLNIPYETKEKRELLKNLFQAICGEEKSYDFTRMASQYDILQIALSYEEKLLIKLCFQEGMNVTAAGKMLGLTRFQVHGKMKRLMVRLRDEFERIGLAEEITLALR